MLAVGLEQLEPGAADSLELDGWMAPRWLPATGRRSGGASNSAHAAELVCEAAGGATAAGMRASDERDELGSVVDQRSSAQYAARAKARALTLVPSRKCMFPPAGEDH